MVSAAEKLRKKRTTESERTGYMIKIGYQGIEGSNAEQAAKDLVKKLNLADVEYVPLVDSPHVIKAMKTGETDSGLSSPK